MSGAAQAHDHATADHDASHPGAPGTGHDDGHGHDGEPLGPIDVRAWGAAILGVASGLLAAIVLYLGARPA